MAYLLQRRPSQLPSPQLKTVSLGLLWSAKCHCAACQQSTIRNLTSVVPARLATLHHSRHTGLPSHTVTGETTPQIPTLRETSLDPLPVVRCVLCAGCAISEHLARHRPAARCSLLAFAHLPAKKLARRDSRALMSLVTPMNACGLAEPTLDRPDFGSTV
jgi:hypothetical protein